MVHLLRGARFAVLKDSIVSAAMDLNCRVLIGQPDAVSALGMKLPVGRVYGTGKVVTLFIPNIGREIYENTGSGTNCDRARKSQDRSSDFTDHSLSLLLLLIPTAPQPCAATMAAQRSTTL